MKMSRAEARQVGDMHEQLRIATNGLASGTEPRVRVLLDRRGRVAACELWGLVPRIWSLGDPGPLVLRRLCDLPAGTGLSKQLVERAIRNAGLTYPHTVPGGEAQWQDIDGRQELQLRTPGAPAPAPAPSWQLAGTQSR